MVQLSPDNTNVVAHRIAHDSLVYECPNCEFGEVLLTALLESDDARCLDCDTRYQLRIEQVGPVEPVE